MWLFSFYLTKNICSVLKHQTASLISKQHTVSNSCCPLCVNLVSGISTEQSVFSSLTKMQNLFTFPLYKTSAHRYAFLSHHLNQLRKMIHECILNWHQFYLSENQMHSLFPLKGESRFADH